MFYAFRFKSMSLREFAMPLSVFIDVFTPQENAQISQLIAVSEFGASLFSVKRRNSINNLVHDGIQIECNRLIPKKFSSEPCKLKALEVTTFTVDKPVLLIRIGFTIVHEYENNFLSRFFQKLTAQLEIADWWKISLESNRKQLIVNNFMIIIIIFSKCSVKLNKRKLFKDRCLFIDEIVEIVLFVYFSSLGICK